MLDTHKNKKAVTGRIPLFPISGLQSSHTRGMTAKMNQKIVWKIYYSPKSKILSAVVTFFPLVAPNFRANSSALAVRISSVRSCTSSS